MIGEIGNFKMKKLLLILLCLPYLMFSQQKVYDLDERFPTVVSKSAIQIQGGSDI